MTDRQFTEAYAGILKVLLPLLRPWVGADAEDVARDAATQALEYVQRAGKAYRDRRMGHVTLRGDEVGPPDAPVTAPDAPSADPDSLEAILATLDIPPRSRWVLEALRLWVGGTHSQQQAAAVVYHSREALARHVRRLGLSGRRLGRRGRPRK